MAPKADGFKRAVVFCLIASGLGIGAQPLFSQAAPSRQTSGSDAGGTRVVIAEGLGSDVAGAAQNAAQNALTQVVGSFIDADTQMKKRTEIQNGIRSETKQIDRSIREYSQGTIQGFEIVSAQQEGPLWRVSARVTVRTGEFKAYITKIAEGKGEVDAGLFAEVRTGVNQSESLLAILTERIQAIASGEVQEFTVGKPFPYARVEDQLRAQYIEGDSRTIVIPVIARLTSSFVENLTTTLEKTAATKMNYSCSSRAIACLRDSGDGFQQMPSDGKFSLALADKNNWKRDLGARVYKFNQTRAEVYKRLSLPGYADFPFHYSNGKGHYPKLRLVIKSVDSEELLSTSVEKYGKLTARWVENSNSNTMMGFGAMFGGNCPPWFMLWPKNGEDLIILRETSFYILLSMDDEQLRKAATIVVSIER